MIRGAEEIDNLFDGLSDSDLVQQCRSNQPGAWATLVRRYQRLVYTVAMRAGLPEDAAADVFQDVFAKLLAHIDRIDDASRVRAWLVTTAKRETLQWLAQTRRRGVLDAVAADGDDSEPPDAWSQLPDPAPLADERLAELQAHDRLRRAVDRLDARSRRLVELMFLQDDPPPYAEVARLLGIPEGSIGPTRARCLAKLRALLDDL